MKHPYERVLKQTYYFDIGKIDNERFSVFFNPLFTCRKRGGTTRAYHAALCNRLQSGL